MDCHNKYKFTPINKPSQGCYVVKLIYGKYLFVKLKFQKSSALKFVSLSNPDREAYRDK